MLVLTRKRTEEAVCSPNRLVARAQKICGSLRKVAAPENVAAFEELEGLLAELGRDEVVVICSDIRGDKVRLAFNAHSERRIVRRELLDREDAAA